MTETLKSKEQLKQDLLDIEEIIWDLRDELHMRILGKAAIQNSLKEGNYDKETNNEDSDKRSHR